MSEYTTLGSLLEFDFERPPDAEVEKLRQYGGLVAGAFGTAAGLPNRYWQSAGANVFTALGKALDRPLTEIIAGGLNHYQPFLKYADPTRYPPGVPVQEELLTHTVDASLSPKLKVLLNGEPVGELKFQLAIALKFEGGTLTIQDGKFMSLAPGKCSATAVLRCAGQTILERKTSELDLPGVIRFGNGIPIMPGARVAVPA